MSPVPLRLSAKPWRQRLRGAAPCSCFIVGMDELVRLQKTTVEDLLVPKPTDAVPGSDAWRVRARLVEWSDRRPDGWSRDPSSDQVSDGVSSGRRHRRIAATETSHPRGTRATPHRSIDPVPKAAAPVRRATGDPAFPGTPAAPDSASVVCYCDWKMRSWPG